VVSKRIKKLCVLDLANFLRFWAFLPLCDDKLDSIPFFQASIPLANNPGIMDKNILFQIINCNEAVSFGVIKKLYNTGCHTLRHVLPFLLRVQLS
jgi:hypothetical protein